MRKTVIALPEFANYPYTASTDHTRQFGYKDIHHSDGCISHIRRGQAVPIVYITMPESHPFFNIGVLGNINSGLPIEVSNRGTLEPFLEEIRFKYFKTK
jgi:hypothetical protein